MHSSSESRIQGRFQVRPVKEDPLTKSEISSASCLNGNGSNQNQSNSQEIAQPPGAEDCDQHQKSINKDTAPAFRHFLRGGKPIPTIPQLLDASGDWEKSPDQHTKLKRKYTDTYEESLMGPQPSSEENLLASNQSLPTEKDRKQLGWVRGVFVPCNLAIFGVMIFLRLGWVVGTVGIFQAIVLILCCSVITSITAMSMSAICSNGQVEGGGSYFMISRSLGPGFGGAIGFIFSLANAIGNSMYVVGFAEAIISKFKEFDINVMNMDDANLVRMIGTATVVFLLLISLTGADWLNKFQLLLLSVLYLAIADFMIGTFAPDKWHVDSWTLPGYQLAFTGYNLTTFSSNFGPRDNPEMSMTSQFFLVFSIFFPAATGILAGSNMSEDLKNASTAIPKGTFSAIFLTTIIYVVLAVFLGATCVRDVAAVPELIRFQSVPLSLNATTGLPVFASADSIRYGLLRDPQLMQKASILGWLIFAGIVAATLSSAVSSHMSAVKVFKAVANDRLVPHLHRLLNVTFRGEPLFVQLLSAGVAIAFIQLGNLNAIAPLISNKFLAAYALINLAVCHAAYSKQIGWRPSFRLFHPFVSAIGCLLCICVAALISWKMMLVTACFLLTIYFFLNYIIKPDVNWGSSLEAANFMSALATIREHSKVKENTKNYRPQILSLTGPPMRRTDLVYLSSQISKARGFFVCGNINLIQHNEPPSYRKERISRAQRFFDNSRINGFYLDHYASTLSEGVNSILNITEMIPAQKPNIVMLGLPDKNYGDHFQLLLNSFARELSVIIVRLPKSGLSIETELNAIIVEQQTHRKTASAVYQELHRNQRLSLPVTSFLPSESTANLDPGNESSDHQYYITCHHHHGQIKPPVKPDTDRHYQTCSGINELKDRDRPTIFIQAPLPEPTDPPNEPVKRSPSPRDVKVKFHIGDTQNALDTSEDTVMLNHSDEESPPSPQTPCLPPKIIEDATTLHKTKQQGRIDVYWFFSDGGFTLLLPWLMAQHKQWRDCKMRVFVASNDDGNITRTQAECVRFINHFRINAETESFLWKKPSAAVLSEFDQFVAPFITTDNSDSIVDTGSNESLIHTAQLKRFADRTERFCRMKEVLREKSSDAALIVISLMIPRQPPNSPPPALYFKWLDFMSKDLPPVMMVRGNQQNVLSFYL